MTDEHPPRRRSRYPYALSLLLCLAASSVHAQGTSTLVGTVLDGQTKKPLVDVAVTATSPNLQGEQTVVTDAEGGYRIPQLAPGLYTLRFEGERHHPYSRGGIDVPADHTLRLNIEMIPDELQEEVVVTGSAPVIDVGSTTTGHLVTTEEVSHLPVAAAGANGVRGFEQLSLMSPQTHSDAFGTSMNGTTSPENSYLVDGLSFNDTARGRRGSDFSVEFLDSVNVITGGYLPEFGRSTGGVQSLATKSGGNEFHGAIFGSWTPGALSQTPKTVTSAATSLQGTVVPWNSGDFGATLGGYLVKDKLWFFAGINPSFQRSQVNRTVNAFDLDDSGAVLRDSSGNVRTTRINDATQSRFSDDRALSYIGKLTYLFSDDERVNLSVTGSPNTDSDRWQVGGAANVNGQLVPRSVRVDSNSTDVVARLNSSFLEKRLLFDTSAGWHHAASQQRPLDFSTLGSGGEVDQPQVVWSLSHPLSDFESYTPGESALCNDGHHSCNVSGYRTGGAFINDVVQDRFQVKEVGTFMIPFLGHHIIKAGVELESSVYDNLVGGAGGHQYVELDKDVLLDNNPFGYLRGPDDPVLLNSLHQTSRSLTVGGFVQDAWSIFDKVTLSAGVRYDAEKIYAADGTLGLDLPNEWSPRIGVVYDFTGVGKSKIYASYARYYEQVPLDIADRALSGNETLNAAYGGCPDPSKSGKPCTPSNSTLLPNNPNSPNVYWGTLGADREIIDPNIVPQSADEIVAGAEYQIMPNGRLAVSYTHRQQNEIIEDMSNNEGTTYFLGNPGRGIASNFPKPVRNYDAVTASFTKTFADLWLAQVSYTYSRLYGNWEGLFRSEDGQLDPNINSTYDLAKFLVNQTGNLSADRSHEIKIYLSKVFPITRAFALTVGGAYNGTSGPVYSARGGDEVYGPNTVYILPRGSLGRLPFVNRVDGKLSADVRFSKDNVLSASVDIFNLIGSQQVTSVDQSYVLGNTPTVPIPNGTAAQLKGVIDPRTGDPVAAKFVNPNFLHATAYQSPRTVQFGVRMTF